MNPLTPADNLGLVQSVIRELLRIARREDEFADLEAATVPCWRPCPTSVLVHRAAARALEARAEALYGT